MKGGEIRRRKSKSNFRWRRGKKRGRQELSEKRSRRQRDKLEGA